MKTISLFLISLVVSANLYANESSKSKNEYENNNDHMGNHIHDGKMTITSPINNLNYGIILYGKNRCKKIITQRVV